MTITIRLNHMLDDADYDLVIDREGAEYIAIVMRAEFERTADAGAFSIAQKISAHLAARTEVTR